MDARNDADDVSEDSREGSPANSPARVPVRIAQAPAVPHARPSNRTRGRRRLIRRLLLGAASLAILAAALWWVIVPQYAGAVATFQSLQRVPVLLVVAAGTLELASLACYSVLSASLLGSGRPSYFTILRIDLSGLAVNHVVPGGGATAAAARFHLLHRAGVRPAKALTTAAIEVTVSNLVLTAFFALGLLLSVTTVSANGYYRTASIAALAVLLAIGLGVWFLTQRTAQIVARARAAARRIPLLNPDGVEALLRTMAEQIRQLAKDPRALGIDLIFAGLNWLLDAAALWVLLAAFGHQLGLGPLLTVYGLGNILAALPLTPGGLGLVEGVMVPALIGFGTPAGVALLGVIGWRLFQFWMPLPLGAAAYLSLRLGTFKKHRERRDVPATS